MVPGTVAAAAAFVGWALRGCALLAISSAFVFRRFLSPEGSWNPEGSGKCGLSLKITACAESGRRDYHGLLSEVVNKFSLQGGLNRQRKDYKEHPKSQGRQPS